MTVWAVVLLPLLTGPVIWAAGAAVARRGRSPAAAVGAFGAVVLLATTAMAFWAAATFATGGFAWGLGLELVVSAQGFAGVAAVLVPAIAGAVVVYAGFHEDAGSVPRLVGLLVSFSGAMELLVVADDLLTLLIAWELVGALSWSLIGFHWRDGDNARLAAHAFNATRAGELGLFVAAGAVFAATGSVGYADVAAVPRPLLDVAGAGVVLAAAAKSAQLPFSPWLFSAMAGPTSVSALLHSATMVAAGAYALIRLAGAFEPLGWFGPVVMWLGLATAVAGGVLAVVQNHGKRVLAASTSAQYGLMFTAVGAGAAGAAAAHLVAHAVFKALLFLGVGVAMHASGTVDIRRMRLGTALPRVAAVFAVGAAALAAVPPLGGAWTKEEIAAAAAAAGPWPLAVALAAGLLSAVYAARLHFLVFGRGGAGAPVSRPSGAEVAVLAAMAAASVALGALWLPRVAHAAEAFVELPVAEGAGGVAGASVALVAVGVALGAAVARGERTESRKAALLRPAVADWFGLPAAVKRVVVDPTLSLARTLSWFDVRVVDGAVRAAAASASGLSRVLARWAERGVDGVVAGLARGTSAGAALSRATDDRAVDAAVERMAAGVGLAGVRARLLQTGLAHQYYLIVAAGLVVIVLTIALGR